MIIGANGIRFDKANIVLKKGTSPIAKVEDVYLRDYQGMFTINGKIVSGIDELKKLKGKIGRIELETTPYIAWNVTVDVYISSGEFKMIAERIT